MSIQKIYRSVLSSALLGAAVALSSCANGPTYAEALKTMPPIPKGKGRVFVYRNSVIGAAIKPKVKIDGQPIGTSTAQGFVYSDQTPGPHQVSLTTEWTHKDTVSVAAGEPSFVRTHVTIGVLIGHVIPTAVSRAEGESEILQCKLPSQ